jgi:4-hydroxymandelate synthase
MNIGTIDHVEFHVADVPGTARRLCTEFGFRVHGEGGPRAGPPAQRPLLLGQGRIRLLLTGGSTPDAPAARYLHRHGDGLARIAMRTDDAVRATEQAARRGARVLAPPRTWRRGDTVVVTATVSGPGDVTHRLVERRGADHEFLPGGMDMLTDPGPADAILDAVDHLALCVPADELLPTVRFYEDVFGFQRIFEERVEIGDQAMDSIVVQSTSGEVTVTIVAPDPAGRPGQIDDFLAANAGTGVQHLALSTRDIVQAVGTLGERGVRFLHTPNSYYDGIETRLGEVDLPLAALRAGNILVDRDHWGEMFQIFTRSTVDRGTFFFELIERHGALTFGTNNIKALYEAKERARAEERTPC